MPEKVAIPPGLKPKLKREPAWAGIEQAEDAQPEDDQELYGTDDDDRPNRNRHSRIACLRHQRQTGCDDHPPVEPGPAIVAVELAFYSLAQNRQRRAGHDRGIQDEHPAGQKPEPWPQGPAHIREVATRGGKFLRQLDKTHAKGKYDDEAEQICEGRPRACAANQCLCEEKCGDGGSDERHVLHDRAPKPHRARLEFSQSSVVFVC